MLVFRYVLILLLACNCSSKYNASVHICVPMCVILLVKFTRSILCSLNVVLRSWGHFLYNYTNFSLVRISLTKCLPVMAYAVPSWYTGYAVTVVSTETHTNDSVHTLL